MKNYYRILCIRENASQEEIKAAYRNLLKKVHPDRNNSRDATHRTREVSEAYSALSCPESRLTHDEELKAAGLSSKVLIKKTCVICTDCKGTGFLVQLEKGSAAEIKRWLGLKTNDEKTMCLDCLGTGYIHRLKEY